MTMDIYQRSMRAADTSPAATALESMRLEPLSTGPKSRPPQAPLKRSFDVAFLMAPDDLSKKRSPKFQPGDRKPTATKLPPPRFCPTGLIGPDCNTSLAIQRFQMSPLSLSLHSPPTEMLSPLDGSRDSDTIVSASPFFSKSAFTKIEPVSRTPSVPISPSSASSTTSNRSPLSPADLTYQDSLSPPHPFMATNNRTQLPKHFASIPLSSPAYYVPRPADPTTQLLDQRKQPSYSPADFLETAVAAAAAVVEKKQKFQQTKMPLLPLQQHPIVPHQTFSPGPGFRPHPTEPAIPSYGFPVGAFPFGPPVSTNAVQIFPGAASLTAAALLPTSLAAFTLPAQNVCAKCNMHFRMTSDLVYHMRSHHKNENPVSDPYKRRRDQDKLKCPVCNESFRERHHLTRHMTAHQDKEDEESGVTPTALSGKEFIDVAGLHRTIAGSAK